MRGDNTDMKKILFITMLMLSLVANVCFASYNITNSNHDLLKPYWGIIPMNEEEHPDRMLYGNYPIVGASEPSAYYIDPSSCNYYIDGDYAIVGCLVYNTGGGANPDGSPAKVTPAIYKFRTFSMNNTRIIMLDSVVLQKTGENITKSMVKWDNGFLKRLFWKSAYYADLSQYLD